MRLTTILLCALGLLLWLVLCAKTFLSGSDPATQQLDVMAGVAVTLVFVATTVPAALLTLTRSRPRLALALALLFPAGLVLLLVTALAMLA